MHRSRSILDHSEPILNLEFSGVFASGVLGGIFKHFGQAVHASGPQAGAQGQGPGLGPGPLGPSLWGQSRSHPMATGRRKLGATFTLDELSASAILRARSAGGRGRGDPQRSTGAHRGPQGSTGVLRTFKGKIGGTASGSALGPEFDFGTFYGIWQAGNMSKIFLKGPGTPPEAGEPFLKSFIFVCVFETFVGT